MLTRAACLPAVAAAPASHPAARPRTHRVPGVGQQVQPQAVGEPLSCVAAARHIHIAADDPAGAVAARHFHGRPCKPRQRAGRPRQAGRLGRQAGRQAGRRAVDHGHTANCERGRRVGVHRACTGCLRRRRAHNIPSPQACGWGSRPPSHPRTHPAPQPPAHPAARCRCAASRAARCAASPPLTPLECLHRSHQSSR